jgi:predicted RecB family nuclease
MKTHDGKWKINSRDIWHSTCDHCTYLSMAVAAGSPWATKAINGFEEKGDKLQWLQGRQFEDLRFSELKSSLPEGDFVELPNFVSKEDSLAALAAQIPVIAQAYIEVDYGHALLTGYADLLVREDYELVYDSGKLVARKFEGGVNAGKYVPFDIKMSSKGKDQYWNQVAGYFEALQGLGFAADREVGLVLRDEIQTKANNQALSDLQEVRAHLFELLEKTSVDKAATWEDLDLHCSEPKICDEIYCEYPRLCEADRVRLDMFTQLYGNVGAAVKKIHDSGIQTVAELANLDAGQSIEGVKPDRLQTLVEWATVITNEKAGKEPKILVKKKPKDASKPLPLPSQGDLFFDLEWFTEILSDEALNYVFGVVDAQGDFTPFESHDFEAEKAAFADFISFCLTAIQKHPDMHIYHWHTPESLGLKTLVERHGILKQEVATVLSHMVDLKPITAECLVVGAGGYGLKALERYYAKENQNSLVNRSTDTADGADSLVNYFKFQEATRAGLNEQAEKLLADILAYNRDDCLSTREVYQWLQGFN